MKLYRLPDYNAVCRKAAGLIAAQINSKPDSVMAWPTGSTPVGVYEKLVELYNRKELDFSEITSFNLDEYRGLSQSAPQSFHSFMGEHLFGKVNVNKEKMFFPDGNAKDIEAECHRYEALIASQGGIDFMFLGIATNGHIAFNEPDDIFSTMTNCVTLHEETVQAMLPSFDDPKDVPRQAITMGIKTLMKARKILLVANGPSKKEIMEKALYGPIVPRIPASVLQLHPDLTVIWGD